VSALAKLHIAKKQLGLDDDTWRDLLERETGKRSSKDMSDRERGRVLDVLKNNGFKPVSKGSRKGIEGKYAPKLQALWIAGYNLGLIRNRDDAALLAFIKRQTGIDHTRFLRYAEDGARAIEALKAGWSAMAALTGRRIAFSRTGRRRTGTGLLGRSMRSSVGLRLARHSL
jgi:phage gp16-like protein